MARYGRQGPVGMGGWLAFFTATLVLNAIAVLVFVIVGATALTRQPGGSALTTYTYITGVIELAQGAGYGFLAWQLLARRAPRTPRMVVIGLWLLALAWPAGLALVAAIEFGYKRAGAVLDISAFRTIAHAAIWTAYLLRSDRVANTYVAPGDDLAAVFG